MWERHLWKCSVLLDTIPCIAHRNFQHLYEEQTWLICPVKTWSRLRGFTPGVFHILTPSTWLITYLAYFLPKFHFNQLFFSFCTAFFCEDKSRFTSLSEVIITLVRTQTAHIRWANVDRWSCGWINVGVGNVTLVKCWTNVIYPIIIYSLFVPICLLFGQCWTNVYK